MGNRAYKIYTDQLKRTCDITFYFEDGSSCTMPTRHYQGIEEDIRRNYYAWRAHAAAYCRDRARIDSILDTLTAVEFRGGEGHA